MNKFASLIEIESLFEKWGQQFYSENISQTAHAVHPLLLLLLRSMLTASVGSVLVKMVTLKR